MSDFSKFRTAVSGFNRTDVVNYIESTSIEHQKALRKLTDERDKLAAENARLQVELAGLQKRLEQAQADNDALSGQVNALAQEGSDLAEQLKKSEEARQELLIRPAPQPEEPAEPAPQPEEPEKSEEPEAAQEPSLTEKELTAVPSRPSAMPPCAPGASTRSCPTSARMRAPATWILARRSPRWLPTCLPAFPACRTRSPRYR